MGNSGPSMLNNVTSSCSVYVALLHHSMNDKRGTVVTTAVTNLDIHDIARSSRTFGVKGYYLVNPLEEQQAVVKRIVGHWMGSGGRDYNPDRSEAFSLITISAWLKDAIADVEQKHGKKPLVVMTSARKVEGVRWLSAEKFRAEIPKLDQAVLLVFGTGWGMTEELLRSADLVLEPIVPEVESAYNHLSVRSAVAIYLDRLLGKR